MEKLFSIYGLLPLTREQIIGYLKSKSELTQKGDKFYLTGGIPYEKIKNGKTVVSYRQEVYSGYEEYFDKMLEKGFIEVSYIGFKMNFI